MPHSIYLKAAQKQITNLKKVFSPSIANNSDPFCKENTEMGTLFTAPYGAVPGPKKAPLYCEFMDAHAWDVAQVTPPGFDVLILWNFKF